VVVPVVTVSVASTVAVTLARVRRVPPLASSTPSSVVASAVAAVLPPLLLPLKCFFDSLVKNALRMV
jgi:hypothetical protein